MKEENQKVKEIRFTSLKDYQNRIATLWQNQKDNEVYQFIFPDEETEKEHNNLMSKFDREDLCDECSNSFQECTCSCVCTVCKQDKNLIRKSGIWETK